MAKTTDHLGRCSGPPLCGHAGDCHQSGAFSTTTTNSRRESNRWSRCARHTPNCRNYGDLERGGETTEKSSVTSEPQTLSLLATATDVQSLEQPKSSSEESQSHEQTESRAMQRSLAISRPEKHLRHRQHNSHRKCQKSRQMTWQEKSQSQ